MPECQSTEIVFPYLRNGWVIIPEWWVNMVRNLQRDKVKEKIIWTIELIEDVPRVPEVYLKHLEGTEGLYEMRVQLGSDIFRIFCFFDQGQ